MQEGGWIKLYRSILKWEWYDDINTKTVFLHLLLTVNVADSKWHGVEIKRGSRVISYASLAKETSLTVREVRTAIEHLVSTGEATRCSNTKFTVISLNNFDKFQEATSKTTNSRQAGDKEATNKRQQYKNKRNKEYKNDEKCSSNTHYTAQQISEIVSGLGYQWSDDELQDFIDFNEARGWKLSPKKAAIRWERQRQRQMQSGKHSKSQEPLTEREIEEMNAYLSLSNRFPNGGEED